MRILVTVLGAKSYSMLQKELERERERELILSPSTIRLR